MGSGPNRKMNDQPIIRIPKTAGLSIPADSGEQAGDICKPSFDVLVTNNAFAIKNVSVNLVLNATLYIVYLAGTEIGRLTERQSTMVKKCVELGVKYKGIVVEDKGGLYARFTRVA